MLIISFALQDTKTQIKPLRNALDSIQALYNFLEASSKRHALFGRGKPWGPYTDKWNAL